MKRSAAIVMILPAGGAGRVFRFSLSRWALALFVATVLLGVFWGGLGARALLHQREVLARCAVLEKEAKAFRAESLDRGRKVRLLTQELHHLRDQSRFIKGFLGLDPRGKRKGSLGQGGDAVNLSSEVRPPVTAATGQAGQGLPTLQQSPTDFHPSDLGKLRRDFASIIETLEARQEELDRTPSISPVDPSRSWVSSGYGQRVSPFTGKRQFHLGVDLAAWKGTPIMATADGKVSYVGKMGPLGLAVKVRHNRTYTTLYGHLLKAKVKRGMRVRRGQVIGLMGNSGRSTGYHVHYAVIKGGRYADPKAYLVDRFQVSATVAQAAGLSSN